MVRLNFIYNLWMLTSLHYVAYGGEITLEPNKPILLNVNYTDGSLSFLREVVYKDSFSEYIHIITIKASFQDLQGVEEGSICEALKLKSLQFRIENLKNESITLKKVDFKKCGKLEKLTIHSTTTPSIEEDAFDDLPNLKSLELSYLVLRSFGKRLLKEFQVLETLKIDKCVLAPLRNDTFENLRNLKYLELTESEIKSLPARVFQNLNSLEHLNLLGNDLLIVTWDEFSGLSSLKNLNLRYNQIEVYDTKKIAKYMPKLETFTFQMYPLNCDRKKSIEKELVEYLKHNVTFIHPYTWDHPCE